MDSNNILVDSLNHDSDPSTYSPLRNIPSELWSTIFIHCLPVPCPISYHHQTTITDPYNIPILLTSVCRMWRQVACSTHDLWTTCWVNFNHPELNTLWLRRAGTQLLSLHGECAIHDEDDIVWDPLLLSIMPFQKRWRSLALGTGGQDGKTTLEYQFDAPQLETLMMPPLSGTPCWIYRLISNAPRLHTVKIDWLRYIVQSHGLVSMSGLDLRQRNHPHLSTLRVHEGINASTVVRLLRDLPQLLHLSFQIENLHYLIPPPEATHTNLISIGVNGALSEILPNLTLPSLRTFRSVNGFDSTFNHFLEQSQCPITDLHISGEVRFQDLITTLQHRLLDHQLERLELNDCQDSIVSQILPILQYYPGNKLLPHLGQLVFDGCPLHSVPEGLVADVIVSRSGSLSCECKRCKLGLRTREIRLAHVQIYGLDTTAHSLDTARLIPLPPLKLADPKDALMTIDLTTRDASEDYDFGTHPIVRHVKIHLGEVSLGSTDNGHQRVNLEC